MRFLRHGARASGRQLKSSGWYARVVAVVGLGGDMFKPFTNTKTCVLFLQKRAEPAEEKLLERFMKDGGLAFAVTQKPGKDKSGKVILLKGEIDSDLPLIAAEIKKRVKFQKQNPKKAATV